MTSKDQDKDPEERSKAAFSRRNFLKGTGLVVAAGALPGSALGASTAREEEKVAVFGPEAVPVSFRLNGKKVDVEVMPATTLLDLLRDKLDLTGTKRVCDRGACGACTILLNKKPVCSCSFLAIDAAGTEIQTIEGLSPQDGLSPLQQAFVDCDALQCGFCTPGMVVSCQALLNSNQKPSRAEIAEGISGNICRCGTYQNVFEAVEQASGQGGKK